ncbi:hypothetical protein D043_0071 [Vibrio parahaemolyticus EKP-021]|nr:hypothetical protein D043_0071 [Vibrio parahaemolyticus EKP-021]
MHDLQNLGTRLQKIILPVKFSKYKYQKIKIINKNNNLIHFI